MASDVCYVSVLHGDPDVDRCNALSQLGFGVVAIQLQASTDEYMWDKKIPRQYQLATPGADGKTQPRGILLLFKLAVRVLREWPTVTIIYGYQVPFFFFLALVLRACGRRVISINDSKFDDYPRNVFKDLIKVIALLPYNAFLTATVRAADYLRYLGRKNVAIYHCAIDIERIAKMAAEASPSPIPFADRYFIVIARYIPKKNHYGLLRAYELYAGRVAVPRKLLMIGYGPLEEELRQFVNSSVVLKNLVQIRGYANKSEISAALNGALALVLPSHEEQFGIVVIEALACAVPVLVSFCCGAADLVQVGVNGFKFEPQNTEGLAYYLELLSTDEELWSGLCAAARPTARTASVEKFCEMLVSQAPALAITLAQLNADKTKANASALVKDRASFDARPVVAVIYPFFPHYRRAVLESLARSGKYKFEFWGSLSGQAGVEPFGGNEIVTVHELRSKLTQRSVRISRFWNVLLERNISAYIILGAPNWIDTWIMVLLAKFTGRSVLLWSHGWLRHEALPKRLTRNIYFMLSDLVLTYSERARFLAEKARFPASRVVPIYNSLDWQHARSICNDLVNRDIFRLRQEISDAAELPILICVGRLTASCRLELLLEAMSILEGRKFSTQLIVIGDGPERASLEALARQLALRTRFIGPMYDEAVLGSYFYPADITVMPGKIGLTAIHSLMYGTPVISHGDLDHQMPEVEAIVPGETGTLFRRNDSHDLADHIESWLRTAKDRASLRSRCQQIIVDKYNPDHQCALIERALDRVIFHREVNETDDAP